MTNQPVAITTGEPAGIGPDIFLMWAVIDNGKTPITVIADKNLLQDRAKRLNLPFPQKITIFHVPLKSPVKPGEPNTDNSQYVLKTLEIAAQLCVQKTHAAMVTAPVHKGIINQAGYHFLGHTHWLEDYFKVDLTLMLFASQSFKVGLYTSHIPLAEVPSSLNPLQLKSSITLLNQGIQSYFGIAAPSIAVCGLNPHAGENGYLGKEEINIITPTIRELVNEGFNIKGPISADSAFTLDKMKQVDATLAMYHDQGLAPIKATGFGEAVNVTLGLPIIRVSVDHGTAFEVAGTQQANPKSFSSAIDLAIQISKTINSLNSP